VGDLIIVLSTIAAAAALWFKFSSDRAARRALELIRRDAPQREPGLAMQVLSATRDGDRYDVELRITNQADAWNMMVTLLADVDGRAIPMAEGTWTLPLVIHANVDLTGRAVFKVRGTPDRLVLIDIDGRRVDANLSSRA
jgi:hypothetical protein